MTQMPSATDQIEDAIADSGANWSHITDDPGPVVWYDMDRDDPDLIVQAVERDTGFTYKGEVPYPDDSVTGLAFEAEPDPGGRHDVRADFLQEYAEALRSDDPAEAVRTLVVESELHRLTAAHAEITSVANGIEGEFDQRLRHEERLAAADPGQLEYAKNHRD